MTDGNIQPNRMELKFPFRSVTLCRLHSVPSRRKRQLEMILNMTKRGKIDEFIFIAIIKNDLIRRPWYFSDQKYGDLYD
uniref:Uncharacterized protein n=1 Tax=Romanomermis culicivorax TaxID=13658 RepID=A0A915KY10_ROMCU